MDLIEQLLIPARLILIVTFLVAGITKLINQQEFVETVAKFGIPAVLQKIIGKALPWIELSLAVFLTLPSGVWWASISASLLLAAFTLLISYNLMQGNHPSCNCFGVSNKPINVYTILRNTILIACSIFLVFFGKQYDHISLVTWFNQFSTLLGISLLEWPLIVIVSIEAWIILKLIRQHGRLILRMDNLDLRLDAAGIRSMPESISSLSKLPLSDTPHIVWR